MKSTIISVNLDGMYSRFIGLSKYIKKQDPIMILLQDLPSHRNKDMSQLVESIMPGYTLIKPTSDTLESGRESVAILVDQSRVKVIDRYSKNTNDMVHTIGISVNTNLNAIENVLNKANSAVFTTYIRPRATYEEVDATFKWFETTCKEGVGISRTIIMGDFNASSQLWAPSEVEMSNNVIHDRHYRNIKENRGRYIEKFTQRTKLNCLNKPSMGPTFKSTNSSSYIDLAFVGNKANRRWNKLLLSNLLEDDKGHKMLTLSTRVVKSTKLNQPTNLAKPDRPTNSTKTNARTNQPTTRTIHTELINTDHYNETRMKAGPLITNWRCLPIKRIHDRLDQLTAIVYKGVIKTQELVTTIKLKKDRPKYRLGLNNARTKRRLQRLTNTEQGIKQQRITINRLKRKDNRRAGDLIRRVEMKKALLKRVIKRNKIKTKIINSLNRLDLEHKINQSSEPLDLWQRTKAAESIFNRPKEMQIELDEQSMIKTQSDIDKLAEDKFPTNTRHMMNYTNQAIENKKLVSLVIDRKEVNEAIKSLRKKKYTSPEGIRMDVFYKSIEFIDEIIYTIAEMSFFAAHVPKVCGITQGTLIPKKVAGQFRIVHVSSPMAALLELIALKRLEYRLEINKLNSQYQFGFTALRGRHDLIARVIELTLKHKHSMSTNSATIIISLDIEGAFDNVDQDTLIKKIDHEFKWDPLKYWLSEFILNRSISIKWKSLKSKVRQVCTGVPQGSALGPILWNYMINDIEQGLTKPGTTELLKYADDILIVHNTCNTSETDRAAQTCLDNFVNKLNNLKLRVRPEKCSTLTIRASKAHNIAIKRKKLEIQGKTLTNVDTLSILGVTINSQLRLEQKESKIQESLNKSIDLLYNIRLLEAIHSADEWRVLIDSFIKSKLIINNWPMLAIDKRACNWIDKLTIKALRTIFNWPNNCSTKLIKLITKNINAQTLVKRMVQYKSVGEFQQTYEFIALMIDPSEAIKLKNNASDRTNKILSLEDNYSTQLRKQFNPEKMISTRYVDDLEILMDQVGPIWIMLDRKAGSMMIEILYDRILQKRSGKHSQYPIGYFNSFALLLKTTQDRSISNRNLIISEDNSLLQALENYKNHDWRVIRLRETLYDNNWRIHKLTRSSYLNVKNTARLIYKSTLLRNDLARDNPEEWIHDFNAWLILINESFERNNMNHETDAAQITKIQLIDTPCLYDYVKRNNLNKITRREDKTIYRDMLTKIMTSLNCKPEIWQKIPPNWLDGQKMLMLTGLVRNEEGQLIKENTTECSNCKQNDTINSMTKERWHQMNIETVNKHTTLHRAITCSDYKTIRDKARNKIERELNNSGPDYQTNLEESLSDRRISQTILRLFSKAAMNIKE